MKKPLWYEKLERWVEGDSPSLPEPRAHVDKPQAEREEELPVQHGPSLLRGAGGMAMYRLTTAFGILCCAIFALLMLTTVAYLPRFGDADNAPANETSRRYIEQGMQEVGATNLVTNIILVYRGFDTYGESCVLFLGATAVIMLLELGTILLLHRKLNRVRQSQQTQTEYTTQPEPAQPEWTPVTDVQPEYWSEAQPGTEPADPADADPGSRIDPEPGVPSDWQAPPGDPSAEQGG